MSEAKIIEGNKLIAEFMGLPHSNNLSMSIHHYANGAHEELKYHSSWDWLMPVVHKAFDDTTEDERQFGGVVLFEIGLTTPISELWNAVVDFIKWHNAETNQPAKEKGK